MKYLRLSVPKVVVLVLWFCCLPGFAQKPEGLSARQIAEATRVTLANSRISAARDGQDRGAVSPEMPIPGITLVFKRSAAQEAALQELLTAQLNPFSPLYHKWLTPEDFAARFGPAEADISATEDWLTSYGFRIENVSRGRGAITFSGTAQQVQAAFGTELHQYWTDGGLHFAPASDLTLPESLASITAAVLHLSDFRPKPTWSLPAATRPTFTSSSKQAHYLTPKDLITMYDLTFANGAPLAGTGQGIAIVGQSFVNTLNPSSLFTFQANLTQANPISPVLVPGSGVEAVSLGDEGESEIDLEYASGIATNANIFFVHVGANQNYSVFDALAFAITERIAPVVSISYGSCEPLLTHSELDQYNALFEEAAAQGQTLIAASAQGVTVAEQEALAVNFPASSPYVTAVGGTQMEAGTFAAGNSPYWANATTVDVAGSLLSYVPEVVWNEGSATRGIAAGGGGSSGYFARPAWQTGVPGIPSGTYRLVPDIALQSSGGDPGFLLCSSDPALLNPQGQTSSCGSGLLGSNNQYTIAGGTSFAAPIFAGFVAILNQIENATGLGNINPQLYTLASDPAGYAAAFHDITSGTIGCPSGAALCTAANESNYPATAGYDLATGLGSIDFDGLSTRWPSSSMTSLQSTGVLLSASQFLADPGQTVPVQIFVSTLSHPQGITVPSGNVSVSVDGVVVEPSLALLISPTIPLQAVASYNFVAPGATGSHLLTVAYAGDAAHAPSTATFSFLVGNVLATGGMTIAAGNLTVANGGTGSTQVTVTPTGGYNGRVLWSLTVYGTSSLAGCYAIAPLLVNNTTTTKLTIGIGSACQSAVPADKRNFRPVRNDMNGARAGGRSAPVPFLYATALICGCLACRRRKARFSISAVLLVAIAAVNLIGCGGGGNSTGTTITATPTATYSITLTGRDSVNGNLAASATFTLTVN
jgi:subtilase family serine protease